MALAFPIVAEAQVVVERSSEIVTIGGVEYYMHHVKQGETLYGISKAYHVSIEEISSKNPEVNDGLQADMVIGIPVVEIADEETQTVQNETQGKEGKPQQVIAVGGGYTVGHGENLYAIAKKFGIDLADFKALNPGLTNEPAEGTVIKVPQIRNEEEYLVHKVELNEKTSGMLRKWNVDEDEFRALNPSVGSHVFVDQIVLIPIEKVEIEIPGIPELVVDDEPEEEKQQTFEQPENPVSEPVVVEEEPFFAKDCAEMPENVKEHYKVALLIPLYLDEVSNIAVSPESIIAELPS